MTKHHQRTILLNFIVILLLSFSPAGHSLANHHAELDWSTPAWIPGLVDSDSSQYPIFVSDGTGKVHAFHSQWVGEVFSIVYSRWITGVGWTEPIDIVLSPREEARLGGVFIDSTGMVNLIFWGGNDQGADIYFTQAPLESVGDSTAWIPSQVIGMRAIAPATVEMVSDENGEIVVLYSGNAAGNGLYSIQSSDWGETWSEPVGVFFAGSNQLWPSALQVYQSPSRVIYTVWSLADETGNSQRIFFAAYNRDTGEWNSPIVLAEAIGYEADTASIIEHDSSLIVIYHNSFPTTRWMIRSFDKGKTWTPPTRLFDHIGSNGAAALVEDSAGRLHMFFGNRVGSPAVHGLWHSLWQDSTWGPTEAIVSGPQILIGPNGEEGFDPSFAQAVTIRGNLLLVVWRHDPMAGPTRIWYSYRFLDTPQLPVITLPAPKPTSTERANTTPQETVTATQTPVGSTDSQLETPGDTNNTILATAILPALALIVILFILMFKVRR